MITGTMVVFAAANALTAAAPSYAAAGTARFVAAAATGLLWASVDAHLAEHRARGTGYARAWSR